MSAEQRKHQVVRELLEDTICEIRGQHPPPVLKGLRKSKRKTAQLDNRVKEVVRNNRVSV